MKLMRDIYLLQERNKTPCVYIVGIGHSSVSDGCRYIFHYREIDRNNYIISVTDVTLTFTRKKSSKKTRIIFSDKKTDILIQSPAKLIMLNDPEVWNYRWTGGWARLYGRRFGDYYKHNMHIIGNSNA